MMTPAMLSELREAQRALGRFWHDRGRGKWLVQPRPEIAIDKEIHAQQRDEIRQRPTEGGFELEVLYQQQRDQGRPDLNVQRVARRAHERLHAEVLFQGLEEEFDLPTIFVDPSNGGGAPVDLIGQKDQG